MKRKMRLNNPSMIYSKGGIVVIARRVFYYNSPANVEVIRAELQEEIIEYALSAYTYLLPVSMQQLSRDIARQTYSFWKTRGWKKIKVDGIKGKKAVWNRKERKLF